MSELLLNDAKARRPRLFDIITEDIEGTEAVQHQFPYRLLSDIEFGVAFPETYIVNIAFAPVHLCADKKNRGFTLTGHILPDIFV